MPAVERTEFPIPTLLPIANSTRMRRFRGLHRPLVAPQPLLGGLHRQYVWI